MLKNISMKNYSYLLEKENETLKRKITHLENERDRAVLEKERMSELLDQYKGDYEKLIADARELIEKQKESEKVMDRIAAGMRGELKMAMGKRL